MLRVFTDFNSRTPDGICWNLVYQDVELDKQAGDLHLAKGDKIILFQDENDFEVAATLHRRHVDVLGRGLILECEQQLVQWSVPMVCWSR
jgi:hypothetical protein